MDQGATGPLRAWPNLNSAAAWSSMVTGYNPGRHGVYNFGDAIPQRGHQWRPVTAADRAQDPFWRLLSRAGQRVGVINVPVSYPADRLNGFMLSGMDAPGARSPGFTHPPDLIDELRQQGIDYVLDVPNLGIAARRAPHQLPRSVHTMVDARAQAVRYLMQTRVWDALMVVFVATDRVQHFFWPAGAVPPDHGHWAPIRELYRRIDAHLACLLDDIDQNTTVLIVSDHGFGPSRQAVRSLNPLFARLGLLCYREGRGRLHSPVLGNLLQYGRRLLPERLQLTLFQAFPGLWLRAISERMYARIDWPRTQVFASQERVHVNLQGREPEGIVPPQEYHALRERVRDILLDVTDPTTGAHLVRAVHRSEEVYHGPFSDRAPDLLIEWEEQALDDSLCYPGDGEPIVVRGRRTSSSPVQWRAGHRSHGIVIACGPHIKTGVKAANATLYDIAPTVLHLQHQPVPRDMDGRVLSGILTESYLRRHPVRYCDPCPATTDASAVALDADEARQVEERLRGLGYLE
jgi:predicted AlkP superfamily phosphohydrolase/phosphomutase